MRASSGIAIGLCGTLFAAGVWLASMGFEHVGSAFMWAVVASCLYVIWNETRTPKTWRGDLSERTR